MNFGKNLDTRLQEAKDRGIQNILALRGGTPHQVNLAHRCLIQRTDPPRGSEEWLPIDPNFVHGVDLVKYIRSNPEYSPHFCVGVAGTPLASQILP